MEKSKSTKKIKYSESNIDSENFRGLFIKHDNMEEIIRFFKLVKAEVVTWEEAINKHFSDRIFIIKTEGWINVFGPSRQLVERIPNLPEQDLSSTPHIDDAINLVTFLSATFGKTIFRENITNYMHWESYLAEEGNLIFGVCEGEEGIIEEYDNKEEFNYDSTKNGTPIDINDLVYQKTITKGIQLYHCNA